MIRFQIFCIVLIGVIGVVISGPGLNEVQEGRDLAINIGVDGPSRKPGLVISGNYGRPGIGERYPSGDRYPPSGGGRDRDRYPPQGDRDRYPPHGDRYPPQGGKDRYPPQSDRDRYPPHGDRDRYPPQNDRDRYPPHGGGDRYPDPERGYVTFYELPYFRGWSFQAPLSNKCRNLEDSYNSYNNGISSVKTHGNCIVVYTRYDCRGREYVIRPRYNHNNINNNYEGRDRNRPIGHSELAEDLNNNISSFRRC